MLWLREAYFGSSKKPMVFVIEEKSLKDDIHVVANADRARFGDAVDVEIFEWNDDLQSATLEAVRRSTSRIPDKTRKMDVLHDYLISTCHGSTKETVIAPSSVTPMGTADIRQILLAVMKHPLYKGQVVYLRSDDGKELMLEGEKILVKD